MKSKFVRRALCKDGQYMGVFRPDDPQASINAAKRALNTNDAEEMKRFAATHPMLFVGWLAAGPSGAVLNQLGEDVAKTEPGDHYIGFTSVDDVHEALAFYNDLRAKLKAAQS